MEVQSSQSFHTKATMVQQAARSSYTCNEAAVGAAISRHDLCVEQVIVITLITPTLMSMQCSQLQQYILGRVQS